MKYFDWDEGKNETLKTERDVSFEEVILAIFDGKLLDDVGHPNQARYPNQSLFIVEIENYAHLVPSVEAKEQIFFKTVIPSRKATKKYLVDKK